MTELSQKEARRRNMQAIKATDTKPELLIRRALHSAGFRYRLHDRKLPGRPDLVMKKHRIAIFVHGCFWHMHGCSYFRWPATRAEFWHEKLTRNAERDAQALKALEDSGWRTVVIWECALRSGAWKTNELVVAVERFVKGPHAHMSIDSERVTAMNCHPAILER